MIFVYFLCILHIQIVRTKASAARTRSGTDKSRKIITLYCTQVKFVVLYISVEFLLQKVFIMKKSVKITLTLLSAAVFFVSAACAVLYFVSCRQAFDTDICHFRDVPLVKAMTASFIAAPVLCAAAGLTLRRRASFTDVPSDTPFTAFASLLCALLFAASATVDFVSIGTALFTKKYALSAAAALFAALSCIYFILYFAGRKTFCSRARIWLSFAPAAWALCTVLKIYFDSSRAINDPIKGLLLLLGAVILLFFCEDVRFYIGRQNAAICYFFTLCTAFAAIAVAVPNMILTLTDTAGFSFSVIDCALYIAVGFFALARLASFPSALGEYVKPSPVDEDAADCADADEANAAEDTDRTDDADGNTADSADTPSFAVTPDSTEAADADSTAEAESGEGGLNI